HPDGARDRRVRIAAGLEQRAELSERLERLPHDPRERLRIAELPLPRGIGSGRGTLSSYPLLRSSSTISRSCVTDTKWPSLLQIRKSTFPSWAITRCAAESGAFLSSSPCHQVTEVLTSAGSKSQLPCMANDSSVQPSA